METYTEIAANDICDEDVNSDVTVESVVSSVSATVGTVSATCTVDSIGSTVGPIVATVNITLSPATASVGPLLPGVSTMNPTSVTASVGPVSATASVGSVSTRVIVQSPISATASVGPVSTGVSAQSPASATASVGSASTGVSAQSPASATASVGSVSTGVSAQSPASATASVGPVSAEVNAGSDVVTDSLGRVHLKTPHTGPAVTCVRAGKLCGSTSETHCKDLKPQIEEVTKEGRSVVIIMADSGPDWNTASLLNAIFFMRLWKQCNLDILCICSYAARYSAYNPIEHLWSPMSKKLNSVRFSAIAEGDNRPPCNIAGISSDEVRRKEIVVFNPFMGGV